MKPLGLNGKSDGVGHFLARPHFTNAVWGFGALQRVTTPASL